MSTKLPISLAIILYLFIYLLRYQQGGWDLKVDLFKSQRQALDQRISKFLPSPQAELLSGILLGENKSLPGHLKLALRDTSTLHIVVASGQNLSMVAGFFLFLSGLIKRRVAITLSFLAIFLYTLLTGVQVPILRAAIMVSFGFLATIFGRERDGAWVLAITTALMLLINPGWITEISFQLSVLATAGVVIVAPMLLRSFRKIPLLGQDLAVSLGAQLMVMPVIAQNFHQLSLVSLPANLLVLWTIAPIMIGGGTLLLFSFIPALGWIVALGLNAMLTYFIYIVSFFSSFSWSWIYMGEMSWMVWIGYYLLVSAVVKLIYDQTEVRERPEKSS